MVKIFWQALWGSADSEAYRAGDLPCFFSRCLSPSPFLLSRSSFCHPSFPLYLSSLFNQTVDPVLGGAPGNSGYLLNISNREIAMFERERPHHLEKLSPPLNDPGHGHP